MSDNMSKAGLIPIINQQKDKFHTLFVLSENGIRAIVQENGDYITKWRNDSFSS